MEGEKTEEVEEERRRSEGGMKERPVHVAPGGVAAILSQTIIENV